MDNNKAIYKAHVLAHALPYMQRYRDKVVVIKYGGNAMINEKLMNNVINDVCLMNLVGIRVVLVHGGGPHINRALKAMQIESKFINGLRYTDQDTIDVVQQVLAGKVNKELVKMIINGGEKAVGLCGIDNMLLETEQITNQDLGYVGSIKKVHTEILEDLLDKNYIPVVASIGMDHDGHSYNINADFAGCAIADALGAENLLVVSDVPGVLRDHQDESSLIFEMTVDEAKKLEDEGIIAGGMIPKINAITDAVSHNVHQAVIIDGRIPHALLIELFSPEGVGTLIKK
ncbi:MAG: acetylglutamate kinase [bacterium]